MIHDDVQIGKPAQLYTDTKANIEALTLTEGMRFYASDIDTDGYYNGSIVIWRPDAGNWSYLSLALTYASATTFTVTGDYTSLFITGTKIKLTQTTVKYFYVVSSSYSAPTTTVTITGGSDYSLANTAITLPAYSYASVASGFPDWFNWTPVYTGFSTNPSNDYSRFTIKGKLLYFDHGAGTNGTSNSGTFSMTLPVVAATIANATWGGTIGFAINNSVTLTVAARWLVQSGSINLIYFTDMSSGSWATSNGKRVRVTGFYEI